MRNNSISDNCSSRDFLTNLSNHSQTNKTFENGDTLDERTIQIVEASRMNIVDHDCETTKSDDNTHDKENFASGNTGSPTNATIEKFRDAVISRQRAIQEDIYRMDVVHYDQGVITTPIEEFKVRLQYLLISYSYFNDTCTFPVYLGLSVGTFLKHFRSELDQVLWMSSLFYCRKPFAYRFQNLQSVKVLIYKRYSLSSLKVITFAL